MDARGYIQGSVKKVSLVQQGPATLTYMVVADSGFVLGEGCSERDLIDYVDSYHHNFGGSVSMMRDSDSGDKVFQVKVYKD